MQCAAAYPDWAMWLKDFGSVAIAIIALIVTAWIQIGQSRTSRTKLKLDLFEQRFGVFQVLDRIRSAVTHAHGEDWVGQYMSEMSLAVEDLQKFRLLFPVRIGDTVDGIVDAWRDFATLKAEGESLARPSDEWTKSIKERRMKWEMIGRLDKELRREIQEFIRIDWRG